MRRIMQNGNKKMTTYQDLCAAWSDSQARQREQYVRLADMIQEFKLAIARDLGLEDSYWENDGIPEPYISVGYVNKNEEYTPIKGRSLPLECLIEDDRGLRVDFQVMITLESNKMVYPKDQLTVPCSVLIENGNEQLSVGVDMPRSFQIYLEDEHPFNNAVEYLKHLVLMYYQNS